MFTFSWRLNKPFKVIPISLLNVICVFAHSKSFIVPSSLETCNETGGSFHNIDLLKSQYL